MAARHEGELQTAREVRAVSVMQRSGVAGAVLAAIVAGGIVSAVLGVTRAMLATVVAGGIVSAMLGDARRWHDAI